MAVPAAVGRDPDGARTSQFGKGELGTWLPACGRPPDDLVPIPVKRPTASAAASTMPTMKKIGRGRRPGGRPGTGGSVGTDPPPEPVVAGGSVVSMVRSSQGCRTSSATAIVTKRRVRYVIE